MLELHGIFIGRVQGVGFRYTAKKYADQLALNGTVKNLSDGSVELIAQGKKDELQHLLDLLEKVFPDSITETRKTFRVPVQPFSSFSIL